MSPSSPYDHGHQCPAPSEGPAKANQELQVHERTRAASPDRRARPAKVLTCWAMSGSNSFSGCPDPPLSCPATQGPPVSRPEGPQDRDSTGPCDNRQQAGKRFLGQLRVNRGREREAAAPEHKVIKQNPHEAAGGSLQDFRGPRRTRRPTPRKEEQGWTWRPPRVRVHEPVCVCAGVRV